MKSTWETPEVSVLIPHYLGEVVVRCVSAIQDRTIGAAAEIIIADDQPFDDGSLDQIRERWPDIPIVRVGGGRGFGAAVNRAATVARGRFLMILNNDTEVFDGWLPPLLAAAKTHPEAGVFQSKVRSLRQPERFDYGGAAGGLIDIFGYPFALGRCFDRVEMDRGQHDEPRPIFWAVGGAMFIRREAFEAAGGFDETFWMHMEEIDLCWRLHLMGIGVRSVPESAVGHYGGYTLAEGSFKKTALNHRNSLVLLLKNYALPTLLWLFPTRCALELLTFGYGILRRDWKHPAAAIWALVWVALHLPSIARRRFPVQGGRSVSDSRIMDAMYRGSIAFRRFFQGASTDSRRKLPAETGPPAPDPFSAPSAERPAVALGQRTPD